jgi:hypothetical protein
MQGASDVAVLEHTVTDDAAAARSAPVADTGCDTVDRIDLQTGVFSIVAGILSRAGMENNGVATGEYVDNPVEITLDPLGNPIVVDQGEILR